MARASGARGGDAGACDRRAEGCRRPDGGQRARVFDARRGALRRDRWRASSNNARRRPLDAPGARGLRLLRAARRIADRYRARLLARDVHDRARRARSDPRSRRRAHGRSHGGPGVRGGAGGGRPEERRRAAARRVREAEGALVGFGARARLRGCEVRRESDRRLPRAACGRRGVALRLGRPLRVRRRRHSPGRADGAARALLRAVSCGRAV